jgi:hypothetical protein
MNTTLKTSSHSSTTLPLQNPSTGDLPDCMASNGPAERSKQNASLQIRAMRPLRFAMGAMISATGMGMILSVAFGMFQIRKFGGDMSLLIVGFVVLLGVMFLGGGFGVMATSSAGFDESEFDRLSTAGNLSAEYDSMFTATRVFEDDSPVAASASNGEDSQHPETPSGREASESDAA